MPQLLHTHETCLYADDLADMERFYTRVLGLRKVSDMSPRGFTLRVNEATVLLIFNPNEARQPHPLVPSHGSVGPGHCAFMIAPADVDPWRVHLKSNGVPIEREMIWPTGAISLYFRDPADNSLELIAGELWPE